MSKTQKSETLKILETEKIVVDKNENLRIEKERIFIRVTTQMGNGTKK